MLRCERKRLRELGKDLTSVMIVFLQFSRAIQSKTFLPINKYNKVPFSKTIVRI